MDGIGLSMPVSNVNPSLDSFSPDAAGNLPTQGLAKDFESLFVSMLLKQMRQSSSGEGLFPGDSSDTYGGIFDMIMGQHIAQNGGIGLAESISTAIQ